MPNRPGDYQDRVYVKELAAFLDQGSSLLLKFAKKHGLLRKAGRGPARPGIHYVSAYAAMRMIAYFRVRQVEVSQKRHRDHLLERMASRAHAARKRAAEALAGPKP